MTEVCQHETNLVRVWGSVASLVVAAVSFAALDYYNYDLGPAGTLVAWMGIAQTPLALNALFRNHA